MGLRNWLLEFPLIYDLLQDGLRRPESRAWFINQVINVDISMRVLDVGCGTASILVSLPNLEYVGINHNPRYIAKARLLNGRRGKFRELDVDDAEFRMLGQFD